MYAIIDDRRKPLFGLLFSLVNLVRSFEELRAMQYGCSVMKIEVKENG
ncbi:hypothetical protein [Enterococcus olivae]